MIEWVRRIFEDSATGNPSVKRVGLLTAIASLSLSAIILAVAAYLGKSVGVEMGAVCTALAGLAGYGYVNGKKVERS